MSTKFVAIIPARYQSTRLPGKPLAMIGNKTMIERVYAQTKKVKNLTKVIVATDDIRIVDYCVANSIEVQLTSTDHLNGTTRCLEVAHILGLNADDVIVNVQGDEPFINPLQIELLLSCFDNPLSKIATLCTRITEDIDNQNIVKVVRNNRMEAIYFSRSRIPFQRDTDFIPNYYKHIGLYAYRFETLKKIADLTESELELSEKLEQLRWLENGYSIQIKETNIESLSVDTPDDLIKAIKFAILNEINY